MEENYAERILNATKECPDKFALVLGNIRILLFCVVCRRGAQCIYCTEKEVCSVQPNCTNDPKILVKVIGILYNLTKHFVIISSQNTSLQLFEQQLKSVSYLQLRQRSVKCALWLKSQKVSPGDIITVLPSKSFDFYVPFLAGFYNGVIVNTWDVNCKLNIDVLRRTRPKIVFADKKHVMEMYALLGILLREHFETTIIIFQSQQHFITIDTILNIFTDTDVESFECWPERNLRDTTVIMRTLDMMTVERNIEIPYEAFLDTFYSDLPFMKRDFVGLWHANLGSYQELFLFVSAIASCVPLIVWWTSSYLLMHRMLLDFPVKWMYLTSTQINGWKIIIKNLSKINKANIPKLKYVLYSYDYRYPTLNEMLSGSLQGLKIIMLYSYPEIGPITYQTKCRGDNIGTLNKRVTLRIIDETDGELLDRDMYGEIRCKSSRTMNGYFQQNAMTRYAFDEDGWICTRDIGSYTTNGKIKLLDTLRPVIIFRGETVSAREIEMILETWEMVDYALVLPILHEVDGHHPVAFIILKSDILIVTKDMRTWVKCQMNMVIEDNLPDSHKLRGGIIFLKQRGAYDAPIDVKWLYSIVNKYLQKESLCYM